MVRNLITLCSRSFEVLDQVCQLKTSTLASIKYKLPMVYQKVLTAIAKVCAVWTMPQSGELWDKLELPQCSNDISSRQRMRRIQGE